MKLRVQQATGSSWTFVVPKTMVTVLVVDDSATIREMLRRPLESEGYQVHLAATADEGLTLARKVKPDVVLLDFVLPDADGLVLLRELRHWGVEAVAIALTGSSSSEVAMRFLRAGAADFLSKEGLTSGGVRAAVRRALMLRDVGVKFRSRRFMPEGELQEAPPPSLLDDPPDDAAESTRALRVLVIDDTQVARAAVRAVLGREGWTIDDAPDVEAALQKIRAHPPDVVLLDYLLADLDGIQAMERLRGEGLRAPVIALSGHGSEDLAAQFLRAGAIDFLPKDDLSEARLVHAIRRAVALHEIAEK